MRVALAVVVTVLFICLSIPLIGQTDTAGTFDENENDFRLSLGISGGITLVNPEMLNDQLAFMNNSLDVGVEKVQTMSQFAAYMRIKPRMAPYMLMRVEAITISRTFDYYATGRSLSNTPTGSFIVTNSTRWTVYPLIVGIGTNIPKTPIEAEVGAIYALGYTTETGTVSSGGSYTNTLSGTGFGVQGRVAPHFRYSKNVMISFEVSYRFLIVRNYSDDFGREVKDFELDLNGMSTCLGLVYTFD